MLGLYISAAKDDEAIPLLSEALQTKKDIVIFVNELSQIRNNNVCVMHAAHLWKFKHPVVALDEESAKFLEKCPVPLNRYVLDGIMNTEGLTPIKSLREIKFA